jgi:hypothetical protein
MKRALSTIIMTAIIFVIAGCEQFSTSYERIDDDEFRVLGFIYEPADAAPGDSVTLMAVFAGKNINLDEQLEWWVSFNMIRDLFGSETVVDSQLLRPIAPKVDTVFSPNTQVAAFRLIIPEDIVRNSASIPEVWTDMLPPSVSEMIPTEIASLTKGEMIDLLESFCDTDGGNSHNIPQDVIDAYLPQLLQFFTVPMRISAKIREPGKLPHTIRSNRSIRYNNRITVTEAPVNTNPVIDSVIVYKVKGNITNIDDRSGLEYDVIVIDNSGNSIIEVEKGYSYFLSAVTSRLDYTITMDGNRIQEIHRIFRQFRLDPEETAGVHHSRYLDINNFNNDNGLITFPSDRSITKFTFWITAQDDVANERMRPVGTALKEVSGRFVYR